MKASGSQSMSEKGMVSVIGATSGIGSRLVARLRARGVPVVAIGRSVQRLALLPAPRRVVDLTDHRALVMAMADARFVVSCVPIAFARAVLDALPDHVERVILTGSTRRFTQFPDKKAEDLAMAETALRQSGRTGVILHPTMICGGSLGKQCATHRRLYPPLRDRAAAPGRPSAYSADLC